MSDLMASLAYLHGKPNVTGQLKTQAEDFFVKEALSFTPSGQGEHFLVCIRKKNENTKYVANELAKACGVKSKDVSWAGLKDRHAVTEQWFSVHLPKQGDPDLTAFVAEHEGVEAILATIRHDKKLRPGDLTGNYFKLVVRNLHGAEDLEMRLTQIQDKGIPNYFGGQRFGINGNNVTTARLWGEEAQSVPFAKRRFKDKSKKAFYLSAARSYLFNLVVSERIQQDNCHTPMLGDLLIDDNTEQYLVNNIEQAMALMQNHQSEHRQHKGWQISAPMAGDNDLPTKHQAHDFEQAIISREPELLALIRDNRMSQDRRAMMLFPDQMQWKQENNTLTISFFLPAGSYATAVMREVLEQKIDGEPNAYID